MIDLQAIHAEVQNLKEEYLSFLIDICNIESNSFDKAGLDKVVEYIAEHQGERGYTIKRIPMEKAGDLLVLSMENGEALPQIVLSAHMDTVYEKGAFGEPPVRVDEKRLYGPGVSDCKGGIAVGLLAMHALQKSGFTGSNIKMILQSDEEVSSTISEMQTIERMKEEAAGAIAFLNLETKRPGKITIERNGIIKATMEIRGKAVHAKDRHEGASAVVEAAHKIIELEENPPQDDIGCNCSIITGGSVGNIVPDYCSFSIDCRTRTRAGSQEALAFLARVAETAYVEGTESTLNIISRRPPMEKDAQDLALFEKVRAISIEHGFGDLSLHFSPGGSDAAFISEAGIPTLDSLGIVGAKYHTTDEYAEIASLAESAHFLAIIIAKIAHRKEK